MQKLIKRLIEISTSVQGQATYLLMFLLIPVLLIVPSIVIDVQAYISVRTHLNNVVDTVALSSLIKSTDDSYRSDKQLYIITDPDIEYSYPKKFREGIENNFGVSVYGYDESEHGAEMKFKIEDIGTLPSEMIVKIEYKPRDTEEFDPEQGNSEQQINADSKFTTNDVEITLSTDIKTPVFGSVLELFGAKSDDLIIKIPMVVKDAVRGARVKSSEDFDQHVWEYMN